MQATKRTFGKEWLHQLKPAAAAAITAPVWLALPSLANASFPQAYFFCLVLAAPVYMTIGALLAALIEWSKRKSGLRGAAAYAVSILAYAAAGAAGMYAYLATVLAGLQIHVSPNVFGMLAIGAGAALYMYHLSLAMAVLRTGKTGAPG